MALTRANATTAISGIIPASNVNNTTVASISAVPAAITTGALTLISSQTASASASISFTSGIDSTYDSYIFKFINIHPSVDGAIFQFNMSTDGGSNYNVTKTTTSFYAYHRENDAGTNLTYDGNQDLAQSTSYQRLATSIGTDNDQCYSGFLQIFNPSSTTYVKHFISSGEINSHEDLAINFYYAGYGNTISAINSVRFEMASGNIDDGIIKMYGVS